MIIIGQDKQRDCLKYDGTICDLCQKGWPPSNCRVPRYRYYAHKMTNKDIVAEIKKGNGRYLKKAFELYAPWKLGEAEKLFILE